jgi:hypothetical protein
MVVLSWTVFTSLLRWHRHVCKGFLAAIIESLRVSSGQRPGVLVDTWEAQDDPTMERDQAPNACSAEAEKCLGNDCT